MESGEVRVAMPDRQAVRKTHSVKILQSVDADLARVGVFDEDRVDAGFLLEPRTRMEGLVRRQLRLVRVERT